ncbi:MAG: hypothetical protein GTN78_03790, partial [Gemmatimonadales bacterium]|nr:hypothetical protein [Gemmatimonadales bacterium]
MIRFENLPTATAEAENIVITDTLDPNLDWNTLEIGEAHIGGESRQPRVVLNPTTRTIAWSFAGANLPPNCDDPLRPECQGIGAGQGSVSFSVKPLPNLPTGAEVHNYATIIFDFNDPMCTNEVVHWIDSGPPESAVLALPVESPNRFQVCWTGQDDPGGTGVRDYTIYVSDDGGPYTTWLDSIAETCGEYQGLWGHTYSFYSVARDNVGNREPAPSPLEPDASTLVKGVHHFHFQGLPEALGADVYDPEVRAIGIEAHDPDHNIVLEYQGMVALTAPATAITFDPTVVQCAYGIAQASICALACDDPVVCEDGVVLTCADGIVTGDSQMFDLRGKGDPTVDCAVDVTDVVRAASIALRFAPPTPPPADLQAWASD